MILYPRELAVQMASEQPPPQLEPTEPDNAGTAISSADPAPPGPDDAAKSSDLFAPAPTTDEPDDAKEKSSHNSAPTPADDVKEIAPPAQESHVTHGNQFVLDTNPAVENDPGVPSGGVPTSQVVADIDAASKVADALALANQSSVPLAAPAQEQPTAVNELINTAIGVVEKPPQASPSSPSSRIPKKTVQGSPQLSSNPPAYSPGGSIPPPPSSSSSTAAISLRAELGTGSTDFAGGDCSPPKHHSSTNGFTVRLSTTTPLDRSNSS